MIDGLRPYCIISRVGHGQWSSFAGGHTKQQSTLQLVCVAKKSGWNASRYGMYPRLDVRRYEFWDWTLAHWAGSCVAWNGALLHKYVFWHVNLIHWTSGPHRVNKRVIRSCTEAQICRFDLETSSRMLPLAHTLGHERHRALRSYSRVGHALCQCMVLCLHDSQGFALCAGGCSHFDYQI